MLKAARKAAGLLVALLLVAGLPLAAARASCVCDHGHEHGAAAAEPHDCTPACAGGNCPMHRAAAASRQEGHEGHASHTAAANVPVHASAANGHAGHRDHAAAAAGGARADRPAPTGRDGIRCSCAGDAQALVGQAVVAGILPSPIGVPAPPLARVSLPAIVETPLRLAASPPAPPPRA